MQAFIHTILVACPLCVFVSRSFHAPPLGHPGIDGSAESGAESGGARHGVNKGCSVKPIRSMVVGSLGKRCPY